MNRSRDALLVVKRASYVTRFLVASTHQKYRSEEKSEGGAESVLQLTSRKVGSFYTDGRG